ncbi:MAG TPA: cytochrome-c oxidase, partial [Armatimonadota bacterium]|nr:cytochrome-c oxidase [Armatimonadota bacterium]
MPYHKKDLESAKIWDVGNYIMVNFINVRDDRIPSAGIPVSYEGRHAKPVTKNPQPEPIQPGKGGVR